MDFPPYEAQPQGFNSQPPEGGWLDALESAARSAVSTHSRPKAAGKQVGNADVSTNVSTHSRPKAAGRLLAYRHYLHKVSTHSRPKAAGSERLGYRLYTGCFNSQPPEGGWNQHG